MNYGKVKVENVFMFLENWCKILKFFNSNVNRALAFVITCCVLHNYCEMSKIIEKDYVNNVTRKNNLVEFRGD
jgi:hypothetical protein